ncbi:hypothetical protein [Deinococcus sonorensis]|uniref:Lincosamide nucleotidyltransferase-like C-terminal domain-containing protein n=2 Tax=Deinococcus sonorensis TaxID=309891 RepID=A0AAU7UBN0_9DEIO
MSGPDLASLDDLDRRIRDRLVQDPRVRCALTYGSRPQGLGDRYSDLEYYAWYAPGDAFDARRWVEAITPLLHFVVNPFGTPNAITPELHRIELHVEPLERMAAVQTWPNRRTRPDAMLIKDRGGQLRAALEQLAAQPVFTPDPPQQVLDQTLNWLAFSSAVLQRGERWRALELMTWVHGGLLRLSRMAEHAEQPLAVTRQAELQLSPARLERLARCTSGLDGLEQAWLAALHICRDLAAELQLDAHPELLTRLDAQLGAWLRLRTPPDRG